jgi:protein tyrosine/serine phosphatase
MNFDQPVALEGVENFRDFGAFSGALGAVNKGRLYRSGHLGEATQADLAALGGLDLAGIVDLRRLSERKQAPNRLPEAFAGPVLVCDDGDRRESPHVEFLRQGDLSDASVEAYLIGYYREALFEPRHRDLFARAFALIAETGGPVLVHCTAGKDRTGMLAALIQRLLGAAPDEVMAGYLATNAQVTPERLSAARTALAALTGRTASDAMLKGYLGVDQRFLETAFAQMDRRCGGLEGYLISLGVGADVQDEVRRRMLD